MICVRAGCGQQTGWPATGRHACSGTAAGWTGLVQLVQELKVQLLKRQANFHGMQRIPLLWMIVVSLWRSDGCQLDTATTGCLQAGAMCHPRAGLSAFWQQLALFCDASSVASMMSAGLAELIQAVKDCRGQPRRMGMQQAACVTGTHMQRRNICMHHASSGAKHVWAHLMSSSQVALKNALVTTSGNMPDLSVKDRDSMHALMLNTLDSDRANRQSLL